MRLSALLRCGAAGILLAFTACGGRTPPGAGQTMDPCAGGWVRLFDDAEFGGRRVTIAYPVEHASLRAAGADAGGGDLNDRASSVRWSIPLGCSLVLYEHENFQGTQYPLVGSGRTEENARLGSFSDRASSATWERR